MNQLFYKIRNIFLAALLLGAGTSVAQCNMTTSVTLAQLSTCDSISINWPAVPGAISYIYAINTSGATPSAGSLATTNSAVWGGLNPSTLYYVWIKTNCMGTVSGWKGDTIRTCGSTGGGCSAPTALSGSGITTSSFNISWLAVPGAISYEYLLNLTYASPTVSGTATTATSNSFTGLTAGTTYYLHLRSFCGGTTYSSWYNVPMYTYGAMQCDSPITITNTVPTCDSVRITWSPVPGVSNYIYAVTQSATPPATGGSIAGPTQNFANRGGLTASTQYYTHVRALCSSPGTGISGWHTRGFTTPACSGATCSAPTTVTATAITASSANFSWTAVPGAIGYEYTINPSATPPTGSGNLITANTQNITSLTGATVYYFHVRTKCSNTTFSTWKTTSITTLGGSNTCVAPATATNNNVTATTANISWTAAANAIGYEYLVNQTNASPTSNGISVPGLTANLSGLTPGTTYYWHIRTKCGTTTFSPWKAATQLVTQSGTAVGTVNVAANFMSIFPNPAGDNITISLAEQPGRLASIEVLSIDGRIVGSGTAAISIKLDLRDLTSGIYFIRYRDDTRNHVIRFIKN